MTRLSTNLSLAQFRIGGTVLKAALAALLIVGLPFVAGFPLASRILIFTIFAVGYNLLLGYGGEMSFGHAAFFGSGAYGTVIALQQSISLPVSILLGVLLATGVGLLFAVISLQRRGIYLSMITLALAQMIYIFVLQSTGLTGGFNGISAPYGISETLTVGSASPLLYIIILAFLAGTWLLIYRVIQSPYGQILIAIRENEERARALGYNAQLYLVAAFTVSALLSGLAGSLLILLNGYVSPDVLFWSQSGEIVFISVIGGIGTLGGPLVGSAVFIFISDYLTALVDTWEFYFGLIVVLVVLFTPEGLYGYYNKTQKQVIDALS
jgi:branched-chain amino acid transport system permease protein